MPVFRYDTSGTWYKGNAHIHSTASDGGKDYAALAAMYADEGYDFLFRTEHWVLSDASADLSEYPLLWLNGVELHGADHGGSHYHVLCLGSLHGVTPEMGLVAAMEAVRAQGGLLILAHPHWTGNSLEDALRWGFHGVEVYNHVCRWLNGKGDGSVYWNAMLQRRPETLAFAVDDAHITSQHPGWNGAWIMVNAPACTREAISAAIQRGNFYSSCGPQIREIGYDGEQVRVSTSPVRFIRLAGPTHHGARIGSFDGSLVSEACFRIPPQWEYAYLELEDEQGRRAWTNTLLLPEQ